MIVLNLIETDHNLLKRREDFSLKLRKDKLQESLMDRRLASLCNYLEDNSRLAIIPSNLIISNDLSDTFFNSQNKLEIALRLLTEKDLNNRQFGIRQVRNYTDTLKKNSKIDPIIKTINYEDILTIMCTSEDLKEVFETSWIVINISQCSTEFTNYLSKPQNLKRIFLRMNEINDFQIQNHFLWIFNNIMGESEETHRQTLSLVDIIEFVCNAIINKNTPVFFKTNCFWAVSSICKFPNQSVIDKFHPILGEIIKYLGSDLNRDIFTEALNAITNLIRNGNNDTINLILTFEIHRKLINFVNSQTEPTILKLIFSIFGNFSYISDEFIKDFFEDDGFEKIEAYLSDFLMSVKDNNLIINKHSQLIKDICWCLGNMCCVESQKVRGFLIRKTNIPKYLLELNAMTSNKEIILEILQFFDTAAESQNINIKTEILRLKVLECFISRINNENSEIKKICLEGIIKLLKFGETIMRDRNIVKEELDIQGTNLIIDELQNSKDDNIAELSNYIILKYFSINEDVGGQK